MQLNKVLAPESIGLNRERCGAVTATEIVPTIQAAAYEEPTEYRGECITSKENKANPKPGDPCHPLSTDERNYICIPSETEEEQ